jgi:hypothetical protein
VGSNPTEGDGFLRVTKSHSVPSFRGEVKPLAPCCKILQHIKNPATSKDISCQLPPLLLDVSAATREH